MIFRKADEKDIPEMVKIIASAIEFLRQSGVNQWQEGYPNETDIRADIANNAAYVLEDDGEIVAMETLAFGEDPTYINIKGKWLNDEPYAAIHRYAVSGERRGKGYGKSLFNESEKLCLEKGIKNIRIDTHRDNKAMQSLLLSCGFIPCGNIEVARDEADTLRTAYQKVL